MVKEDLGLAGKVSRVFRILFGTELSPVMTFHNDGRVYEFSESRNRCQLTVFWSGQSSVLTYASGKKIQSGESTVQYRNYCEVLAKARNLTHSGQEAASQA